MLLDSASLYFRAFYGVPETVVAPDGTPVNAVRGLLDMIAFLVGKYQPDRLVACMDADWRPAFRVAAVPSYKAHRVAPAGGEEVPDTLSPQVPILQAALDGHRHRPLGVAGHEADDVIGTLATVYDGPVDIVTGDRDLFQLVRDDKPVRVLYTAKGMRDLPVDRRGRGDPRYGIPGRSYADFALLRGDPSDGLPGVPGRRGQDGRRHPQPLRLRRGLADCARRAGRAGAVPLGTGQAGRRPRLPGGCASGGGCRVRPAGARRTSTTCCRASRLTRRRWSSSPSAGGSTPR